MTPRQAMHQRCTADLAQFAAFLELPLVELDLAVRESVADNPFLEQTAPACTGCGLVVCRGCGPRRTQARAGHDDPPAVEPVAAADPRAELASGARVALPAAAAAGVAVLVEHCDDRGVLTVPLRELVRRWRLPSDAVADALRWLRAEAGPGVAADTLVSSLRLRLAAGPAGPLVRVADVLLRDHLDELAGNRLGEIARALDESVERVAAAVDLMRAQLWPVPSVLGPSGAGARSSPADVVVRVDGHTGELVVELAEDRIRLRVSPELAGALGRTASPALRSRLADARSLVERLVRRRSTLRATCELVVGRQRALLCDRTPAAPDPLTRADVATALGVHESTVSRAVAGRVVRRPDGRTIALADLFDRSRGPKELIRRLVAAEREPLPDRVLRERLAASGVRISRRTVAKYRSELGIPVAGLRAKSVAPSSRAGAVDFAR